MTTPLEVVAAVFHRDRKVLVCRKKSGLPNAGQWEFPGGKRESGESFEAALVRELAEELHVTVVADQLHENSLGHSIHNTGDALIKLHCFVVSQWQGEFVLTDHDAQKWCSIAELRAVNLSDADVPFVDRIEAYLQKA